MWLLWSAKSVMAMWQQYVHSNLAAGQVVLGVDCATCVVEDSTLSLACCSLAEPDYLHL